MWKMGWFGVVMGHPKSLKIASFDNSFEFVLLTNYVSVLHRF